MVIPREQGKGPLNGHLEWLYESPSSITPNYYPPRYEGGWEWMETIYTLLHSLTLSTFMRPLRQEVLRADLCYFSLLVMLRQNELGLCITLTHSFITFLTTDGTIFNVVTDQHHEAYICNIIYSFTLTVLYIR